MDVNRMVTHCENLGNILRETRRHKGVGLDVVSKDLKIAFKYLEALEDNNVNGVPSQDDFKKFLKAYCEYLKLDYGHCFKMAQKIERRRIGGGRYVETKYLHSWPRLIRRSAVVIAFGLIFVFFGLSVERIFSAPELIIFEPKDDLITTQKKIDIIGKSEPEVTIIINNMDIFVDGGGNFKTSVDLQSGLNLIKITAKKRYSRLREVDVRVLSKDEENPINTN